MIPTNAQNPPDWQEILTYFRGSELQNYFTKILEDNLKVRPPLIHDIEVYLQCTGNHQATVRGPHPTCC
jgi:translation initiation factor RLI1